MELIVVFAFVTPIVPFMKSVTTPVSPSNVAFTPPADVSNLAIFVSIELTSASSVTLAVPAVNLDTAKVPLLEVTVAIPGLPLVSLANVR